MTGYFAVKGYDNFQHYKDRRPPWIKLYNTLLDDYEFGLLPDASKSHLIAIWLLASRYSNRIPHDAEWISRQISATEFVDLNTLSEAGFIIPDQGCSKTLAECKQSAPIETEGEEEVEVEETNTIVLAKKRPELSQFLKDAAKKKGASNGSRPGARCPANLEITERDREYARKQGLDGDELWPGYIAHFTSGQGRNKTASDWRGGNSAWGTWCRNQAKWTADRISNRPQSGGAVAAVRALMD